MLDRSPIDESQQEPGSCVHWSGCEDGDKKDMVKRYKRFMLWAGGVDVLTARALKQRKPPYPHCAACNQSIPRPTVCLTCESPFCRIVPGDSGSGSGSGSTSGAASGSGSGSNSESGGSGAPPSAGGEIKKKEMGKVLGCGMSHVEETGHEFTLDTSTGTVRCHPCADYIYPESFVVHLSRCKRMAEERADGSALAAKRARFKAWKPTPAGDLLVKGMTRARCHGLRPLLNLSQTCFLSAILQAFLNNPLLRSYYLSDKHNRLSCEARRSTSNANGSNGVASSGSAGATLLGGGDDDVDGERDSDAGSSTVYNGNGGGVEGTVVSRSLALVNACMSCEMDRAFDQAYSEDSAPYGPISMLAATWKASNELAGISQQDAHTFFLAALNQIHTHSPERADRPEHCRCAAHQAFSGSLLSTVTCAKCHTSTQTEEPLLDLNLELKPHFTADKSPSRPELHGVLTLADCLRRYTGKEVLSDRSYACATCRAETRGATKQLSIKRLPATLAIQFKRFEHIGDKPAKVETMVHFPTHLDMRRFTSDVLHSNGALSDLPTEMFQYQLSAVVTHEGKLDNGHYWADVRSGYEWFKCDDDKVTNTTLASVLGQRAYMLFYVKKALAYEVKREEVGAKD